MTVDLTKDECLKLLGILGDAGHCAQDEDGVIYTVVDCELCKITRKINEAMKKETVQ